MADLFGSMLLFQCFHSVAISGHKGKRSMVVSCTPPLHLPTHACKRIAWLVCCNKHQGPVRAGLASTSQGRAEEQHSTRRTQNTQHMTSRINQMRAVVHGALGPWLEPLLGFFGRCIQVCVLHEMFKPCWRLTRYHCWFHMGSSNSLSAGQSLHSLRDALLLRRFSYCCSAHNTCAHRRTETFGLFSPLK